jgi:hypothetical protein
VLNDADIEMAELAQLAHTADAARRAGRCPHGGFQGRADGSVTCLDCGQEFPSEDELHAARAEVLDS